MSGLGGADEKLYVGDGEKEPGAGGEDDDGVSEEERRAARRPMANPDVLFDRYRGARGVAVGSFLKLCRDAFLLDNSWTYQDALSTFHALAHFDKGDGDGGGDYPGADPSGPILGYEAFVEALRRIARQSSAVLEVGLQAKKFMLEADAGDEMAVRWEGFRQYVGAGLNAAPRSDEDSLLVEYIYSDPVLKLIWENEFRLRRVYKKLTKRRAWASFAERPPLKLGKLDLQRFLRELIPKDLGGPIRQEDVSSSIRFSNFENTGKEQGSKDAPAGDSTLPELMEMMFRCAMGFTPISWSMRVEESAGDRDPSRRPFDTERGTAEDAAERINILLQYVWDWLEAERIKDDDPQMDEEVLMEECPIYDSLHADVQMVFMHYCTGEPYSEQMDYTDPMLLMESEVFFRFCRDSGIMDSRVTYSAIFEAYSSLVGKSPWEHRTMDFAMFRSVLSRLARLKYEEARAVVAVTMMLEQWLVPMVNMTVSSTPIKDFIFTEQILSFFLVYEVHVGKMFEQHATVRETILGSSGIEEISGSHAGDALEEPHRRIVRAPKEKEEEGESEAAPVQRKVQKVMTLIDLNSFLKTLSFVPDMITVEEVPEIFDQVVNATPHLQVGVNDATMCVSQLLEALTSCALLMYSRPPYSAKYATREEKVLAMMERVEVGYCNLFNGFMSLEAKRTFPSSEWKLIGLSKESQFRDFLLARRLQRGASLVAVRGGAPMPSDSESNVMHGVVGTREYVAVPERTDGRRPPALGIPSIIREQLYAPDAPYPVGPLMETALIHHNAARYKAAVETYLQALNTWNSTLLEGNGADESAVMPALLGKEFSEYAIDDVKLLFFIISLGGVYESAGLDELALACYSEGRFVGDRMKGIPEEALSYSAMGNVLYHLGQHGVALSFFTFALRIREGALGERHMDSGLLYNNMGACYDVLNRVTEAIESYQKASDVFQFEFGLSHPRTSTVMRNLARVKQRRFDFHVSFAPRKPTPCPARLVGQTASKKKGKKGGKGGKKKKK